MQRPIQSKSSAPPALLSYIIKLFVISRRIWLFGKTPRWVKASAIILIILETAKEKQLILPITYRICLNLPKLEDSKYPKYEQKNRWIKVSNNGLGNDIFKVKEIIKAYDEHGTLQLIK